MARFNIPGLLGAIGELPSVINRGLLGNLPVNPQLGLDPTQVQQSRDTALNDLAFGMIASPRNNPGAGLYAARQSARENFSGRMVDLLREQEIIRMKQDREKNDKDQAAYRATLPPEMQPVADVAGLPYVAQQQVGAAFAPATSELTDDIKEYRLAVQQGFTGSLQDWIMAQKRAGATSVNVNNNLPPQESRFLGSMGEGAAKQLDGLQTSADGAQKMLASINVREPLANNPQFISGTLGDTRLTVAKALGLGGAEETQAYFAAVGEQVAERIKAFGAGTGLSDADREFAKQIAAGSIELTPGAIKRIIRINKQTANEVINKYQDRRKFYGKTHKEVFDYYPDISAPGQGNIDSLLDKYAP